QTALQREQLQYSTVQLLTAQFVGALVDPLVANWIRSEVDRVDNLSVDISGSDNNLLNGRIDTAEVSGDNLVYEDFYLSRVELAGSNIRLTVDEALNGGSLNLVEPVSVDAFIRLSEADLNRSLQAPLIQSQLADEMVEIPFAGGSPVAFQLSEPQVSILDGQLKIDARLNADGTNVPISVTTGLSPQGGTELLLIDPTWLSDDGSQTPISGLNGVTIDLGPDVAIDSLELLAGELIYNG
ncbi:MAG: DUF2993 domain-containing protein, partial [Cyanobacteria bacterium J06555_12]